MTRYYVQLALRGLQQHRALTALMVFAIGLGIAATMTGITIMRRYGNDPIPQKSSQLFAVQLDAWTKESPFDDGSKPPNQLTYPDAIALMEKAPAAVQTVMYAARLPMQSANIEIAPTRRSLRATRNDFFAMFQPVFRAGGAWSDAEDAAHARVIVLSVKLAEYLFGSANPLGQRVQIRGTAFSVIGVIEEFAPKPKFYDLNNGALSGPDEAYVPFSTAIELEFTQSGNTSCWKPPGEGWAAFLVSECIWLQYWAQLDSAADKAAYSGFLDRYSDSQAALGRFTHATRNNRLLNVREFLHDEKVVPQDSKLFVYISAGFLLVCLINALGLMLAKFLRRAPEMGVRRALGASKKSVFIQHVFEAAAIGAAGAIVGTVLTLLGLYGMQALYSDLKNFAVLDLEMLALLIGVSISASVLAGLLPAWRISQLAPARALKSS
jgi:putative ABC transport system permease protein